MVATIASSDKQTPWIANVFFVSDSDLNIYYLSSIKTRHSKELIKNSSAAVSIYDIACKYDFVHGVQIEGEVFEAGLTDVMRMLNEYIKKYPESLSKIKDPKELASKLSESHLYKIKPKRIVYTNSSLKAVEGTSRFEFLCA